MSSRQPDDDGFEVPSAHDMWRPGVWEGLYGNPDSPANIEAAVSELDQD
jgi:hypothetical protein